MRSRLLTGLILTFFALLGTNRSDAQVTSVSIDSAMAWSSSICSLPDTAFVNFSGHTTGTPGMNDSLTLYINFGDGTDTTWRWSIYQNQGWWWAYMPHVYTTPGTYSVMYAATTDNGHTDTVWGPGTTYSNNCSSLSGDLYIDANGNCTKDVNEVAVPYAYISITGGGASYFTYADMNGHYAMSLPTGVTYTITPNFTGMVLNPTCPVSGVATVTLSSSTVSNFAYDCNSSVGIDYAVSGYASNWRPNHTRILSVHATGNNYCITQPVTITATLPAPLTYVSTVGSLPVPIVVGNTLTWTVTDLTAFNSWFSMVNIMTDSNVVTIGDTLCVDVTLSAIPADANAANNYAQVCAEVNNSWDPNDKNVSPKGNGTDGAIVNGTKLTYKIRFQNTGNDVAYDITVKDLVDQDLDLSTLHVIESSHNMKMVVVGREINFRFENINLPDSGSNEPMSHGHILYSISPNANLPLGTTIENTANIYFDYNPAVITNTTVNTIAAPTKVEEYDNGLIEATVAPNPANSEIRISVKNNESFRAELFDIMGRLVKSADGKDGKAVLSVSEMTQGIYILRLSNKNSQVLTTKINILH